MIFSHVLYQLSYLATEVHCARGRGAKSVSMLAAPAVGVNRTEGVHAAHDSTADPAREQCHAAIRAAAS
jgi:hypothetical protein